MSEKVAVRCVELDLEFESIVAAAKAFGSGNAGNISNCVKGNTSTAYGYHWVLVKPKKTKKQKRKKPSLCWECTVCKRYLGDEMELKYACLQPPYCEHCGQALDWSDTE